MKDLQDKNSPRHDVSLDQRQMGLRILARMIAKSVLNVENPVAIDEDNSGKNNRTIAVNVDGRPRKVIPIKLVLDLSCKGFSTREIANELPKRGYESVSYQTVARVIAKKR